VAASREGRDVCPGGQSGRGAARASASGVLGPGHCARPGSAAGRGPRSGWASLTPGRAGRRQLGRRQGWLTRRSASGSTSGGGPFRPAWCTCPPSSTSPSAPQFAVQVTRHRPQISFRAFAVHLLSVAPPRRNSERSCRYLAVAAASGVPSRAVSIKASPRCSSSAARRRAAASAKSTAVSSRPPLRAVAASLASVPATPASASPPVPGLLPSPRPRARIQAERRSHVRRVHPPGEGFVELAETCRSDWLQHSVAVQALSSHPARVHPRDRRRAFQDCLDQHHIKRLRSWW